MPPRPVYQQKGSLTVLALFVIIILALLGLSLFNQLRASSQNVVVEVQGTRAYFAAQTGLEMIATQAFPVDSVAVACNNAGENIDLDLVDGLQNCTADIRCSSRNISENGVETLRYYQFESTGICGAGSDWASRTLAQEAVVAL